VWLLVRLLVGVQVALLWLAFVALQEARAIRISAVYLSGCARQVGVIISVDESRVWLLTLEGQITGFPRHEAIYLAHYPLGALNVASVPNPGAVPLVTVKTRHGGVTQELVQGWMIDHSEEEFSFLNTRGSESVVHVNDIWDISTAEATEALAFDNATPPYHFAHPYPFRHCEGEADPTAGEGVRAIYPQQLVHSPLLIKREFDHLEQGHERIRGFIASKPYYPVPQLYSNQTRLGIWLNGGARHGASHGRSNNFTPVVHSGLSEGPFGFQRIWVAGAAPMPFSVHEEPQTQLLYRLKADHLHFSVNYDISAPLIGEEKYNWHHYELGRRDERWNELFHVAGGFDYATLAADLSVTTVQYALRHDRFFFTNRVGMPKFGLNYQNEWLRLDFYYGLAFDRKPTVGEIAESSSNEDIAKAESKLLKIPDFNSDLRLFRFNTTVRMASGTVVHHSLIYRMVNYYQKPSSFQFGEYGYASRSITNALYMDWTYGRYTTLTGFLAHEALWVRGGVSRLGPEEYHGYPKGGLSLAFAL